MTPLYEDNHIIIVNKASGEIVQGDKTGDTPLSDLVKAYLKEKYAKPGEVFLGVVHRLDRPVSGVVVFAKTSKALTRLNEMFRKGEIHKTYHAIIPKSTPLAKSDTPILLTHFITRNEKQNNSYAFHKEVQDSKKATLDYQVIDTSDRYALLQVNLHTGRHHQIRCQLATALAPIKGDLKYGSPRSNPDGSICLHAQKVSFIHPVSKQEINVSAPYPTLPIWGIFSK